MNYRELAEMRGDERIPRRWFVQEPDICEAIVLVNIAVREHRRVGAVGIELVKIVICLLDWSLFEAKVLSEDVKDDLWEDIDFDKLSFTEAAYKFIVSGLMNVIGDGWFEGALNYLEKWAKHLGIDLEELVRAYLDELKEEEER